MRTFIRLCLGTVIGLAAQSQAEDLMSVYQQALTSDPTLAATEAALNSTRELVPQARANFLPSATAEVDFNHDWQQYTYKRTSALSQALGTPSKVFNYPAQNFVLSILQPVYHHENFVILRQSKTKISQALAEYDAARQDLMIRVAQSYFDILAAQDSLETVRAEKQALGRQLEQSKQRFGVGLIAITDVHDAQAGYDSAIARAIAAENQLANTKEALRAVIGTTPGEIALLSDRITLTPPDPTDVNQWAETAIANNFLLASTQFQMVVAREQVEAQRAGHYPRVDLVSNFSSLNADGNIYGGSESWNGVVGLRITVPLYQGGGVSSRIRQAEADYTRARDLLEQRRRATVLAARSAYLGVIAGISQVQALKQAVISNESARAASEAGYEVGTRTLVDVLNAQRLLYAAKRDYSSARYTYVLNILRLKQAAGQLGEGDLSTVNAWLDSPYDLRPPMPSEPSDLQP